MIPDEVLDEIRKTTLAAYPTNGAMRACLEAVLRGMWKTGYDAGRVAGLRQAAALFGCESEGDK